MFCHTSFPSPESFLSTYLFLSKNQKLETWFWVGCNNNEVFLICWATQYFHSGRWYYLLPSNSKASIIWCVWHDSKLCLLLLVLLLLPYLAAELDLFLREMYQKHTHLLKLHFFLLVALFFWLFSSFWVCILLALSLPRQRFLCLDSL